MSNPESRLCRQCHARISPEAHATVCPVCGGVLITDPGAPIYGAQSQAVDHRGILLPRRHAVGGVITPR